LVDDNTVLILNIDAMFIKVYLVGDVHLGAAEHMAKEWGAFRAKLLSEEDSYMVLVGDLMNNGTRCSKTNVYEETMPPSEQKRLLFEQLKPLADAGKILCGTMGNHEGRSVKDVDLDPLYDVFVLLGIADRYRRNMCFMKLRLSRATYIFCVSHGASPARTAQFATCLEDVDVFITGHTHSPKLEMPMKIRVPQKGNKVSYKEMHTAVVPSWLAYGGYGMSALYSPKVTGKPQIVRLKATSRDTAKKISITQGDDI
jgi:predicted phosphodiesterase